LERVVIRGGTDSTAWPPEADRVDRPGGPDGAACVDVSCCDIASMQQVDARQMKAKFTVLEGLRGECSIAELCRREGIAQSLYYKWSKECLEAGKKRLSGDAERQATSSEVKDGTPRDQIVRELILESPYFVRDDSVHWEESYAPTVKQFRSPRRATLWETEPSSRPAKSPSPCLPMTTVSTSCSAANWIIFGLLAGSSGWGSRSHE
jgi:hypothetical protein